MLKTLRKVDWSWRDQGKKANYEMVPWEMSNNQGKNKGSNSGN